MSDKDESYPVAPSHALPKAHFYTVEYPGYIAPNPSSVSCALDSLGGPDRLDASIRSALREKKDSFNNANASESHIPVELHLRPDQHFAHPVPGHVVSTGNLVLKVTTRRRKRRRDDDDAMDADSDNRAGPSSDPPPQYTAEIIGSIPKTVRFRSEPRLICSKLCASALF